MLRGFSEKVETIFMPMQEMAFELNLEEGRRRNGQG